MLDQKLLELLVCPVCKGELEYDEVGNCLLCHRCSLRYRIENGIPIMLPEKAEKIERN
ncbi:MAG: tetraacyldisaccharide 4'-kinase [candidate division Zixibacteria bacterium 4484_93]|nr:MAG: tetraacyldisaccharide 4'-kinase [candidate division Zixibacteria bacterium 4484_93]RKZ34587.1 MAG: Trm112 family protein [bacterium]